VLLIATGVLLLAHNLFDYSLLPLLRKGVVLFADYWPLLLVAWGMLKVYQRLARPARARVGAFEVVLLVLFVLFGLSLTAARHVLEDVSGQKLEDLVGFSTSTLIGVPAHRFISEARFDLASASELRIVNPGGKVNVRGGEGTEVEVQLTKRVHHLSEMEASDVADGVRLDFDASGSLGRLEVVLPEGRTAVECDLDVRVPRSALLAIENRRGRVSARDIDGSVRIETAHDAIEAGNLKGGLEATTRHGEIRVRDVSGAVRLVNDGGAIVAEKVAGDLRAASSHGRLVVEDVTGNAVLDTRHASVQAARVGGELQVTSANGDVSVETAGRSLAITGNHGAIFVRDVQGSLTIEATNAGIQARDIAGDVRIANRDEPVTLVGVGGSARVVSPQGAVTVEAVEGAVEIETSQDDVRVSGFGSSLKVQSSHAAVRIASGKLAGNVSVETTYGDVELQVPPGASLRLEATTRDGELHSSVSGLEIQEERRGSEVVFRGAVGSASHAVTLKTSYGDVVLAPEAP
jgi:DUF4097 and DUF4098 domain-containing protein YvlB